MKVLLVLSLAVAAAAASRGSQRERRAFPIFNIVQIKHEACTVMSDTSMRGTCMSQKDCEDRGGIADGNCAASFGMCCMFVKTGCGMSVGNNCTYIQNEGYPAAVATANQNCRYTFERICDDLCQVRLDFDKLTLEQPDINTRVCVDTAVAMSDTGASPPSNICGTLDGQHMYLEAGGTGNAGSFTINTGIGTTNRSWKIKVTYIECSNPSRAPADCVQYFTGTAGTIMSYNFKGGRQLAGQNYDICFRQEQGTCSYQVQEATGVTTPEPFAITDDATQGVAQAAKTSACRLAPAGNPLAETPSAYILIPNSRGQGPLRCGGTLSDRVSATIPGSVEADDGIFSLSHYSSATGLANQGATGFNLDFNLLPCNG